MKIRDFQNLNAKRSKELFPQCQTWDAAYWMTALVGEVGEAANVIKKILRDGKTKELKTSLQLELGDIMSYLVLLSEHLDIDLQIASIKAFNKVLDRHNRTDFLPIE